MRTTRVALVIASTIGIGCGTPMSGADAGVDPFDAGGGPDAPDASEPAFTLPIDLRCAIVYPSLRIVNEVVMAPDGSVLVLGALDGDADLDPGPDEEPFVLSRLGTSEAFLARFDADCTYRWTRVFETGIADVDVAPDGEIVVVGFAPEEVTSIDFDPGPGADRRTDVSGPFVTRFGPDGSYRSTTARDCGPIACGPVGASGTPFASIVVAPDGTAYTGSHGLRRWERDGTQTWPGLPPDAGVPSSGLLGLAPDGSPWLTRTLEAGDLDWTPGVDRPTLGCRVGDPTCIERQAITRVTPEGGYGGSIVGPLLVNFLLDAAGEPLFDADGNLYLFGTFDDGTGGVLAPDFDFSAGVDRRTGDLGVTNQELFTMRMAPDGTLGWVAPIIGTGDSTGSTGMIRAADSAFDREEGVLYAVGFVSGGLVDVPSGPYGSSQWLLAQDRDGHVLFATHSIGIAIQHVAARDGRFVIAGNTFGMEGDLDLAPESELPWSNDQPGTGIAIYELETCVDGERRPGLCGPTCVAGRWGTHGCARDLTERNRRCLGCADVSADLVPCGMHTDACGATASCGACQGSLVCAGAERTCEPEGGRVTIATGLDHPEHQMALDATHVYFVVGGPYPPDGMLPGVVTLMRAPRDGSGPATVITTAGRHVAFDVSATHVYMTDQDAHTFSRIPKDGSGPLETIATDLHQPSRPIVDGTDYVYYTAARESSPIRIFELHQYDQISAFDAVADSMGDRITAFMVDPTHVWATSTRFAGMYRWPRGVTGVAVPELVGVPPASVTSWIAPGMGYFDGTGAWTIEHGETTQRTWTGGVRYEGVLAATGLNHVRGLVGDTGGLFAAVHGDQTATTDTGAIVRIW